MEKIQLTEQQARDMFDLTRKDDFEITLRLWKRNGFIKKSAVEEAVEKAEKLFEEWCYSISSKDETIYLVNKQHEAILRLKGAK